MERKESTAVQRERSEGYERLDSQDEAIALPALLGIHRRARRLRKLRLS